MSPATPAQQLNQTVRVIYAAFWRSRCAAPNPLSIPTTVTPLAHDACIASRAVTPSSPAPYPTDVGTATTGHDRETTDHAGECALHAGDDDDRVGGGDSIEVGEQPVQPGDPDVVESVGLDAVGGERDRPPRRPRGCRRCRR